MLATIFPNEKIIQKCLINGTETTPRQKILNFYEKKHKTGWGEYVKDKY